MIDAVESDRTATAPWPAHMGDRWRRVGLWARTVAHLRPSQAAHRLRLRARRAIDPWWPGRPLRLGGAGPARATDPGWPAEFRALESRLDHGDAAEVASGRFCMLGEERSLGEPADWRQADAPRLWRFCLHYFEWSWALAALDDRPVARESFARLWRSWQQRVSLRNRDAWAPYVVSLRAWVLCDIFGALVAGSSIQAEFVTALHHHARFVRSHLEFDVGGNHLVKNLKALVGLGVFLGDPELVALGRRHLARQLTVQILADGGHFERSPSYHCQVLGDLLDVEELLRTAGEPPMPELHAVIGRMQHWLGTMLGPDGEVPLLNDAVAVGAARLGLLSPQPPAAERLHVLAPSGYVVVRPDPRAQLVVDVGDPCPDELPAHAHADCLSFELWVDGRLIIADTGTSTYEPGARRAYERSTAAHNTVEVDGVDQTEVWGTFRAARRARGTLLTAYDDGAAVTVVASHNGYRRLPGSPVHRRRWVVSSGKLEIDDTVEGAGAHALVSRLHVDDATTGGVALAGRGATQDTSPCRVARRFGELRPAVQYRLTVPSAALPRELGWSVTW
jgi:uncharacterized heparinase superfamily protein